MDERKPHAVLVPGPGLGLVNGCLLLANALISAGFCVTLGFERAYKTHASKGRISVSHASVQLEILPDGLPPDPSSYLDLFHVTPSTCCTLSPTNTAPPRASSPTPSWPGLSTWQTSLASLASITGPPLPRPTSPSSLSPKGYVGCHKGLVPSSWKIETPVFVDCIPGFASFPLDEVPKDFRHALLENDPLLQRFMEGAQLAKHAHCVLIHSVYDLEREAFEALQNAAHIEAFPIGPLVHQYNTATSTNSTNTLSLMWLDAHAPSSVIFVSFGSNFVHTNEEIVELAHGLEASGKAFLWVIRSDSIVPGCDLDVVLPRGFQERTTSRGLIVSWVSQLKVLAHPAVGGFLSHCGWNSTLESMWMGVPMLTCPKRAEQPTNSRFISKEWGVGIELETTKDGTFSRNQVEIGICALLDETVGNQARAKARKLSQVLRKAPFEGGQSHSNLLKFASKMKELCLQHR